MKAFYLLLPLFLVSTVLAGEIVIEGPAAQELFALRVSSESIRCDRERVGDPRSQRFHFVCHLEVSRFEERDQGEFRGGSFLRWDSCAPGCVCIDGQIVKCR